MPAVYPKGAAVRGQFLDIEECQAVGRKDLFCRDEREIGEVLVVDRVELVLRHQAHQVGKLNGDDTLRFEEYLHAFHKIVDVRHLRQNIVADDQICLFPLGIPVRRRRLPKNLTRVGTPFSAATATLAAGSTPRTGMPFCTKYWSR